MVVGVSGLEAGTSPPLGPERTDLLSADGNLMLDVSDIILRRRSGEDRIDRPG
jgi:hypothetical protein